MTVYVDEDSLNWALAHAERQGDTGIFPTPFEFQAIRFAWDELRPKLSHADLDTRPVEELRRCLTPKGRFSYRVATQLDPIDFLFFTALVYEVGHDLENFRLPSDGNIVHSFRFNPDETGRIFDSNYNYSSFLYRCRELVDEGSFSYVVVADIADFFPRIYLHRIESALQLATAQKDKARAIIKLIKGWNERVSYGIPVGSAPARLVAEITIHDVDQCLVSEDTTYCRYSDDFRIFCRSMTEAYSKLETLALVLYENHGLFLQPGKTEILPIEQFERKYLQTPFTIELLSLRERFGDIMDQLGLDDPYGELDYDELEGDLKNAVDSLNLQGLLEEQLEKERIDISLFRFILRRLGQLNQPSGIPQIFSVIDKCYHAIPEVVSYLKALRDLSTRQSRTFGEQVINIIMSSIVGQLPYNRCWLLSLFADTDKWGQERTLIQLFNTYIDPFCQRKVILSLGSANQNYWFRRMKSTAMHLGPWPRRAFIAAASCMAPDEVRIWHSSLRRKLDVLENAIVDWVTAFPFA